MTIEQQIAMIEADNRELRRLAFERALRSHPRRKLWMRTPHSNSLAGELKDLWAGRKRASV